jgi:hypothetical protein
VKKLKGYYNTIPLYRHIIYYILITCLSVLSLDQIIYYKSISYFNLILIQINNATILCFPLLYAQLLIIGNTDQKINFIYNNKLRIIKNSLIYSAFIALYLVITTYIINFIVYGIYLAIRPGLGVESLFPDYSNLQISMSFILYFLRLLFVCILVYLINSRFNNAGIFIILFVSFIDWMFNKVFWIMEPTGLLPIENTNIFYTAALIPDYDKGVRLPFTYSILYWFALVLIVCILYYIFLSDKKFIISIKRKIFGARAFSILSIIFYSVCALIVNLRSENLLQKNQIGFDNLFYYSCMSGNPILTVIAPILAIHASGLNYDTNITKKSILKNAVFSGCTFVIANSLLLCGFFLYNHQATGYLETPYGVFSNFNISLLVLIIIFNLHTFLFGFISTIMGYGLKLVFSCNYAAYIGTLLIYNIELYNPLVVINSNINNLTKPLPTYFFSLTSVDKSIIEFSFEYIFIVIISILLISIGLKKARNSIADGRKY